MNVLDITITTETMAKLSVPILLWMLTVSAAILRWVLRERKGRNGNPSANGHNRRMNDNNPGQAKTEFDVINERCEFRNTMIRGLQKNLNDHIEDWRAHTRQHESQARERAARISDLGERVARLEGELH